MIVLVNSLDFLYDLVIELTKGALRVDIDGCCPIEATKNGDRGITHETSGGNI